MISFFKNRKLRVDILTIFLFLISLSSLMIISFTYSKITKSIVGFSTGVIQRASSVIIERVDGLIETSENLAEEALSFLLKPEDDFFDNEELINYMLRVVKNHPNMYGIYFGRSDGSLLEVVNLAAAYQTHYIFDTSKPLPAGSAYVLRYIDRGAPEVKDIWYYKDQDLKTIASESLDKPLSNPTTRNWYKGAISTKGLYWTPVYAFDPLGEPGITVSKAIFNSQGTPIAAVGVDISLNLFSHFLTKQNVSKSGRAFILNTSGQVIIPETIPKEGIDEKVITRAYLESQKQNKKDFVFIKDRIEYLASVNVFPVTVAFDWIILIVAPLNDFMGDLLKTQREVVFISFAILVFASLLVVYFSKRISIPIVTLANETDRIRRLDFKSETRVHSNIQEIKLMDSSIAAMRVAIRSFGKYIPKEIVMQLIGKGEEIAVGGQKKEATVLFSDIEGFTSIAETCDTEKLMALLAEYFDAMSKIILQDKGIIDKFIGDGIMALWGAPNEMPDHAFFACKAALECEAMLSKLNERFKNEGKPIFNTRIGIDTGEVIAGNVGTADRMNYTAMGNTVNTAARLQSASKTYHTKILISEKVQQKIGSRLLTRPLDIVELKGMKEKTKIYELMDSAAPGQVELSAQFTHAFEVLQRQDRSQAKVLFQDILQKFPEDGPTKIYLERLK